MGELVNFRQPATPRRQPSKPGETAEILFFTGVRYVPVREQARVLKRTRQKLRRTAGDPRQQDCPSA